jgi:predicted nucleic-acid-binding Zn-ribbon protein
MPDQKNNACPKCGGKMDEGRIPKGLSWLSGYKSLSQKHFSLEVNFEKARACLNCGYIEMYLDPDKLRKKLSGPDQEQDR